jgi:hypothetical protein
MGVDQPECGAGRASPAKWSNTNTGEKNSETFGCRAVQVATRGLQFGGAENGLLAIMLQNPMALFSAARTRNSRCLVLSALFSLKMRCA